MGDSKKKKDSKKHKNSKHNLSERHHKKKSHKKRCTSINSKSSSKNDFKDIKEANSDSDNDFCVNSKSIFISKDLDNYDVTGYKIGDQRDNCEIFGYTNDNNPFMDDKLGESFQWKKNKYQSNRSAEEIAEELENVRRRRREHEKMREERRLEQEMMQRAKEAETYLGRKTDSSFDVEQAKNRSKIRISDGRAKPIDLLIEYINAEEHLFDVVNTTGTNTDIINHEPMEFICGLNQSDLEDLAVDIDEYSRNIEPGRKTEYWNDISTLVQDELSKFIRDMKRGNEDMTEYSRNEINKMFMEQPICEAEESLKQAHQVLEQSGDSKHIIPHYWEYACRVGKVILAKRRLHERHLQNLTSNLDRLRAQQGVLIPQEPIFASCSSKIKNEKTSNNSHSSANYNSSSMRTNQREEYLEMYSPQLLNESELAETNELLDNVVYNADDDKHKLIYLREQYLQGGSDNINIEGENKLLQQVNSGSNIEDVEQIDLGSQSFLWSDKYRPRRPKFLNRVNTGFDWNKYNQTHYDIDNPPPKVVQGYKFNILYPDLIDKTKTPHYELTACPDDDQYAILTFKSGPPYEDIAFKVVNREWETSERHGFKCQFYKDSLQLHFHFKRYRYRK